MKKKIKKIPVTPGVIWVEIPDAELYILCGCPADSVKHLMKRGLILPEERQGVVFETGPNVILLSDVMLQNGQFANMAEFPVLQMLYKQGMILPNHPNNTGQRPLLMGMQEQVEAQMQYIYRGNYGLVSEEEMIQAGATAEVAAERMRMKLKFSFGHILPTRKLLDALVVDHSQVEIRSGASIRRLRINVFEISFQDETVEVDLNLGQQQSYESPYPLGYHDIKREYFAVVHSGEGDGWDINRPSMGSVLMFQGRIYLVDAGPNIAHTLRALGIGINEVEGLFHTHAHDDHFAGLTTLMRAGNRINYFATPMVKHSVAKKLSALLGMDEEHFDDFFRVVPLVEDEWNNVDGLEVRPIFSPHPVETTILLFRALWAGGQRTYAHFSDIASFRMLETMRQRNARDYGLSDQRIAEVKEAYLTHADVKKIDAGGGMIHGDALDFADDTSPKLLISHMSRELLAAEKAIGASAPFGTVDVLIPTEQSYAWRSASEFLRSYFPSAPVHQVRVLLNSPLETFNPGSHLLREGHVAAFVMLILSGNGEMVDSQLGHLSEFSAGAMVGEISVMYQIPVSSTFRSTGFLRALKIPADVFLQFIQTNKLHKDLERLQEHLTFMRSTPLLGGGISYVHQTRIARAMESIELDDGDTVITSPKHPVLYLIREGRMDIVFGERVLDSLGPTDFFGEESALFHTPGLFLYRVQGRCRLFRVPGRLLSDVPMVRWKLLESYDRRRWLVLDGDKELLSMFRLREGLTIHVNAMDNQHKHLLDLGSRVLEALEQHWNRESITDAVDSLIAYTQFHYQEEENLLRLYQYPDLDAHRARHRRLLEQVRDLSDAMKRRVITSSQFGDFFRNWMVDHILGEDRKYGSFLNDRGVF
ncbi:MAG: bacteriohemerythrin [Magnetococcus sp. WYHC-3]